MKKLKFKWIGLGSVIFAALFLMFYPKTATAEQDVTPPKLERIEIILPKKGILDVGDTIKYRAKITDQSEIELGNSLVYIVSPYGKYQRVFFNATEFKDIYEASYTLQSTDGRGNWYLYDVILADKVGNGIIVDEDNSNVILGSDFKLKELDFNFGYSGIENNKRYNYNVTPEFNGSALLNGINWASGVPITTEGNYSLSITEPNGEITTVPFSIDKTPPSIYGVKNNGFYNKAIYLTYTEGRPNLLMKYGGRYNYITDGMRNNYMVDYEGNYYVENIDDAGNKTKVYFTIDKTAPTLNHSLSTSKPTNSTITVNISGKDEPHDTLQTETAGVGYITLPDGKKVNAEKTSYKVSKNGSYTFKIADKIGNTKSKTIKVNNIDKTAPKVGSSLSTTKTTNKDVEIKITGSDSSKIENITLPNKKTVKSSSTKYKVSKNGYYTFKVKDKAGNVASKTVKVSNIDKSAPGKPSVNKVTSKSKTVTGKGEKNSTVYVYKGSKQLGKATVNSKGTYTVKIAIQKKNTKLSVYVQDKAGNKGKSVSVTVK